jgi:hypothetical protein
MNGDDFNGEDAKGVYFPAAEQEEALRNEARLLLDEIRASRVCVFLGIAPRRRTGAGSWLYCLQWADAYDVLLCFEPRRGKAAIRAKFAELEEHVLHNLEYSVGDVTITKAVQEPDLLYRDVIQQPIFFPESGIVWRTGKPEQNGKEKKWLHSGLVSYEIRRRAQPPRQGQIRVIHIGYSSPFAWPLFMMPHQLKPAMVILNPPPGQQ